jgi:spermidine synthase
MRRVIVFAVLLTLFLASGFSALVYQIVWLRMLGLVFGVTVHAASAVLTSFMGGLALGSWLGGRIADRSRSPLRAFALVEIGVALSAVAVPALLRAAAALYANVHAHAPDAPLLLTAARLGCAALVLLVPTTLMGASLPLLSRYVAGSAGGVASRIGVLYAANTTGAICGVVSAGFVLIGGIGVAATTRLAVLVNIVVGLGALGLAWARRRETVPGGAAVEAAGVPPGTVVQRRVLIVFALAGFAGLALEVVWFRLLVLFIPATTYAFTTMLAVVLLGLASGSAIASRLVKRAGDPVRLLARVQIATGLLVLLSVAALALTYRRGWRTSGMIQACVVAMLPATTLMGMTFPLGLAIWLEGAAGNVGRRVGVLYATNVCGAVAGALSGGFVLLPLLGTRWSLLVLAAVYGVGGCFLIASKGRRAAVQYVLATLVLLAVSSSMVPDPYGAVIARRHGRDDRLLFRSEGVQTTAAVHVQPSGHRVLYLDGLHQANDTEEMVRVHAEIGHLPMLLHPDPARSLVIGLGGGVTAGTVASHRTTTDVVELARSVIAAAPFFSHVNGDLLRRPTVRLRVDDGRNYLLLTSQQYDVVTADIIQPVHAGAGNLYSREYFRLASGVLRDGGLMLQWIGHRDDEHYRLIMRTFLDVFPHATLWSNGSLMVGSRTPLRIRRETVERQLADPDIRTALHRVGLDSYDALLARYTAGPEEMQAFLGTGPVLTDDRPLLEYHRSLDGSGKSVDVSSLRGDVARHLQP